MAPESGVAPAQSMPHFHDNHNFGRDQIQGVKYENHNWFQNHLNALIFGILAILGTLALALSLPLVLKAGSMSQSTSSSSPKPGAATSNSGPTTSPVSQTAPMTTPEATSPCTKRCYKEYLETGNCGEGCPGAYCADDNGCIDPYPCITHICCRTGCKSSWSCSGECAPGLTCVTATTGTAASTCQ